MDLDPTFRVRTTGTPPAGVKGELVRELVAADLSLLSLPRGSETPNLKRIRDTHHALARMLASGKKDVEVAAIMGYSFNRISLLRKDPAFAELLEFYRKNADLEYANLHERLARVSASSLALLQERMDENPDGLSEQTLIDLAKLGADRTGHGPQTKSLSVNYNLGMAERLAAARQRVQEYRDGPLALPQPSGPEGTVIDGEFHDVASPPPGSPAPHPPHVAEGPPDEDD